MQNTIEHIISWTDCDVWQDFQTKLYRNRYLVIDTNSWERRLQLLDFANKSAFYDVIFVNCKPNPMVAQSGLIEFEIGDRVKLI